MALDVAGVLRDRRGVADVLRHFGQTAMADYLISLPRAEYNLLADLARESDAGHRAQRNIDGLLLQLSDLARDFQAGHELPDPEAPF